MNNLKVPDLNTIWFNFISDHFKSENPHIYTVIDVCIPVFNDSGYVVKLESEDKLVIWNQPLKSFYQQFKSADPRDIVKRRNT